MDVNVQGTQGVPGAEGSPAGAGGPGGDATATSESSTDTSNTAEATGGTGGGGGKGLDGDDGVVGGPGGSALAVATTTAGSASGNAATATATGGTGGVGGVGTAPAGLDATGGDGGTATANASAVNALGAATATANDVGGAGNEPANGGLGVYYDQPYPAVLFSVGGAGADVSGSSASASGTTAATATVDQTGGDGGEGPVGGAGGSSTLADAVSGQTSDGVLNLTQTATGGSGGGGDDGGYSSPPGLGGAGGNATSDLTLADTTSATIYATIEAQAGQAGEIIVDGGPVVSGAGGDAHASGDISGAGRVSAEVESYGGDGGATGGRADATDDVTGVTYANAYVEAGGGRADTGHGGDGVADATALATGPTGVANATSTASGGMGTTDSGNAAATSTATGASGTASATAVTEFETPSGGFSDIGATATSAVLGTTTAVAQLTEGGALPAVDTSDAAVAYVVVDPDAGADGLAAAPGGALLFDTEQGGGHDGTAQAINTATSDVTATLDLSAYAADSELTVTLADATLVGSGVTGVTFQFDVGESQTYESFSSGADALAYFTDNVIDLGDIADVSPNPKTTNIYIDLTVTTDDPDSGFYADPLFAEGTVETASPCFVSGTLIRTPHGDVAVEDLRVGDHVVTLTGRAPIVWIGRRRVHCRRHAAPETVSPIRIRAHALGQAPTRDLLLSPDHALWIDGVLVRAHLLVDGEFIVQESRDLVTYIHVELDRHDVLFAEDLPAESYLDTGNRAQFANGPLRAAATEPRDPYAPLVGQGPQLTAILGKIAFGLRPPAGSPERRRAGGT